MAVKIRLKRMGQKKAPFYRIVVADARAPRDGKFIEEIGTYDPNPVSYTHLDVYKRQDAAILTVRSICAFSASDFPSFRRSRIRVISSGEN